MILRHLCAVLALLLEACGGDDPAPGSAGGVDAPVAPRAGREPPMTGVGLLRSPDGVSPFVALPMDFAGATVDGWDVSSDEKTLLVVPRDTFNVQRSTDGGMTFAPVALTAPSVSPNGALLMLGGDPARVLFHGNKPLYRTTDGFTGVQKVLDADGWVEDLEQSPSNPQIVYAAARGLVIYRSDDEGATWKRMARLRQEVVEKK